jgi:hypothetical protein
MDGRVVYKVSVLNNRSCIFLLAVSGQHMTRPVFEGQKTDKAGPGGL